jgi:transcriptional regulator GlxA family with amidase domain
VNGRILHLKKQIVLDLQRNRTLNKLAKESNVAKSQLTKLFQAELNISPVQYIRNLRLEKACQFLETTFLRVKEGMFIVGINDQSHFVRDFKEKYGLTPTEYRNRYYEKLEAEENTRQ